MYRNFKKNNVISDSESESEESLDESYESNPISPSEVSKSIIADSSLTSENSINDSFIEDSLPNASKLEPNTPGRIIEESIIEDSSESEENNVSLNVSIDQNISDIQVLDEILVDGSKMAEISEIKIQVNESNANDAELNVHKSYSSPGESDESIVASSKAYSENSTDFLHDSADENSRSSLHKSTSSTESDRSILIRQIADKTTAYQNIMRAVQSCNPKKLKDGGKLLQEKMTRCKEELDYLKEKLKNLEGDDYQSPHLARNKIQSNSLFTTKDLNIANLGKKGIESHRVQAALTIDALVTIHESLTTCPSENTFETDPEGLKISLMPHQKHALAWLLWREHQTPPGGILADDMGLGKTLSILSLILRSEEYKRKEKKEINEDEDLVTIIDGHKYFKGKTLVVCPASLVGQWEEQIRHHCKSNALEAVIHHGKTREIQAKRLIGFDVVITTYGVVGEENKCGLNGKKGVLFRIDWERIVLDEAHVVRNPKTQRSIAVCDLMGKYRWCLTGTPVQNRELDMYSLLKFIRCAPFDDRNVWKRWVDNKTSTGVERLQTVIKSILLRRTKEDLKKLGKLNDLPEKKFIPVYVELDKEELKVYHEVLIFSKTLLAEYLRQKEFRSENYTMDKIEKIRGQLKGVEDIKTTEIFVLLLRLRQICCLPGLIHSFLEKETCIESELEPDNPVIEDLYTQMSRMSIGSAPPVREVYNEEKIKNVLLKSNPVFKLDRPSTKIQALLTVIREILSTDDKIVIVSQWTNLLKKIETHIQKLNVDIVTLDGTIPVKFRSKIIEDFNRSDSNVRIMLLSLNAGGVGLNLLGGNRLIIFEPHWNPQLESQACDRVYRVGQKKKVFIYKIICRDTIEERIELLQKQKLELANTILQETGRTCESRARQLTLLDLATLFQI